MLARTELPSEYQEFNERWGAPGRHMSRDGMSPQQRLASPDAKSFGRFAFQYPSDTRTFEYPFAGTRIDVTAGQRVLDVGAGLSGLQFLLAEHGCKVVCVDPAAKPAEQNAKESGALFSPGYWMTLNPADHAKINDLFGTDVELVGTEIQNYDAPAESFDRVVCLSVLEHVEPAEAKEMVAAMCELLAPGGKFLLTVDLFLDTRPFGVRESNIWGRSHDVYELVKGLPLAMTEGDRRELLGFPEFDFDRVVELLPELLISRHYPVMTQSLVLEKTPGASFA